MKQLPIIWQRLVSGDGRTCQRCDATSQHLQSSVARLRDVLKPLNIEPILELREIDERSFRNKPAESNRIWIAGKPVEEWLAASVGSSPCCSVCGVRLRGSSGAQDEFTLAAAVQNLRKLAKLVTRPPPLALQAA